MSQPQSSSNTLLYPETERFREQSTEKNGYPSLFEQKSFDPNEGQNDVMNLFEGTEDTTYRGEEALKCPNCATPLKLQQINSNEYIFMCENVEVVSSQLH